MSMIGWDYSSCYSIILPLVSNGCDVYLWVDGGYTGEGIRAWVAGLKKTYKLVLEVVENQLPGCHLVKRRGVVERTLAWLFNVSYGDG